MRFLNPSILLLLFLLPVWLVFLLRRRAGAYFRFSSTNILKAAKKRKVFLNRRILTILRLGAVAFIIVALARPQAPAHREKITTEGIDIALAVDVSTSMLAEDFEFAGKRQNRLYVVKRVVDDFIKGRHNDKIAVIAFAGRAYTVCPLTLDYNWIITNIDRIKIGIVEDGTAIGSAIATSLNRLRQSKAKSKVLILLTDGRNNAGDITPRTAAGAAKALGVKMYTIGAGTKGLAPYPVQDFFGNTVYRPIRIDIDDQMLAEIAKLTGGEYFRATDTASLKQIYARIDKMEKTVIEETGYTEYRELFVNFLLAAMVLLLLEIVLGNTVLRRIP